MNFMAELKHVVDPQRIAALCTCGNPHPTTDARLYAGKDAFAALAEDCRKSFGDKPVLVIDDENTRQVAGKAVAEALKDASVSRRVLTMDGDAEMTEDLANAVLETSGGNSLILAVGAGTINDLGKYVATRFEIPYWAVPTAPSMNGYTSSIAAVKVRGVKRTLPAAPPRRIYANPGVIQRSPLRLRQSGFCDVLAKSVSDTDWKTESTLFSGSYCSLPTAIVAESEEGYLGVPEKIRDGDEIAVNGLFHGLLISGAAMTLAGSSAPASGGEHLVSHVLDMRESLTGRTPELHGLQVGAGVILSALCYQKLATLESDAVSGGAEKAIQEGMEGIDSIWGPYADEVRTRFLQKRDQLLRFDALLPKNWDRLRKRFAAVRSPEFFLDLIRRTGFPMTLEALRLSKAEFLLAALSARAIRERITVLDLAAHAGILEASAEETAGLLS